jgi:hypothetical protein
MAFKQAGRSALRRSEIIQRKEGNRLEKKRSGDSQPEVLTRKRILNQIVKKDSRSLFLRLGDLEDRLVCDDIAVQHLSMESYTPEREGD